MHLEGSSFADGVHTFVGLPLHIELCGLAVKQLRQVRPDLGHSGSDFGRLASTISVGDPLSNDFQNLNDKESRSDFG